MRFPRSKAAAFTLIEVLVTAAVVAVSAAGVFEILRTGLILSSKNTAMNLSHSESRNGLLRLQQDLRAAVATPELTDSSGAILFSGTYAGPAAGVSVQVYAGGPFCLYVASSSASVSSSATSIQVVTGTNFRPLPGQTIHIQALPLANSLLEGQLSGSAPYAASTTSSGVTYTPTLSSPVGTAITLNDGATGNALHVACFFTTPIRYVVVNGQLVKYFLDPAGTGKMLSSVLSYDVTVAKPFSMPTVNSSPQNTFLSVTNLTASDPSSDQRGYHSTLTPLTIQIPHFSQLTTLY